MMPTGSLFRSREAAVCPGEVSECKLVVGQVEGGQTFAMTNVFLQVSKIVAMTMARATQWCTGYHSRLTAGRQQVGSPGLGPFCVQHFHPVSEGVLRLPHTVQRCAHEAN